MSRSFLGPFRGRPLKAILLRVAGALAALAAAWFVFGLFLDRRLDHVEVVGVSFLALVAGAIGSFLLDGNRRRPGRPGSPREGPLRAAAGGFFQFLFLGMLIVAAVVGGLILAIGWGLSHN